jgi:hypothetical protein
MKFIRENFIVYFYNFNKYFNKEINEKKEFKEKEMKKISFNEKYFKDEATLKTFCFKFLAEKFSRLILLNFSMFKFVDFCCIFFESFFLLKFQKIIENISKLTLEILMEKQIEFFELQKNNENLFEMHILLFYLCKITIKIFNNKSNLFEKINLNFEEKIEMIQNFLNFYKKVLKSRKNKFNNKNNDFIEYEKNFYENFILNGISFALEKKSVEIDENEKKIINLENVFFLEIVKIFLKSNLYLKENDIKNIIVAFLKLTKSIELTEGINLKHLKVIENFKSYVLNKAKVVVNENEEEKLNENIKNLNINENSDEKNSNEKNSNEKNSNEKKISNKKFSKKNTKKKRNKKTYNEIIKEENEDENDEEEIKKKKKKIL